jgi:hypothetical protein
MSLERRNKSKITFPKKSLLQLFVLFSSHIKNIKIWKKFHFIFIFEILENIWRIWIFYENIEILENIWKFLKNDC